MLVTHQKTKNNKTDENQGHRDSQILEYLKSF